MRSINLQNPTIINRLNQWNEFCFSHDRSMMQDKNRQEVYKAPYRESVSKEYLFDLMKKKPGKGDISEYHEGYPESMYGVDMPRFWKDGFFNKMWCDQVFSLIDDLNSMLVCHFNALAAYYPPGGYIGWHNNWNCPGYNILMTWSATGEGAFEYWDHESQSIVTMPDKAGEWTAKVGYYGGWEEPEEKHFWHCAYTECERLTFSYVIPDRDMWLDMIEDLEDPNG